MLNSFGEININILLLTNCLKQISVNFARILVDSVFIDGNNLINELMGSRNTDTWFGFGWQYGIDN